jgi:hypothetical protein
MLSWPFSLKENGTATILPLHINRRTALPPSTIRKSLSTPEPSAAQYPGPIVSPLLGRHNCGWHIDTNEPESAK